MDKNPTEDKQIKKEVVNIIDENRVVAFSDAVFAFAATLLVLKIELPEIAASQIDAQFIPALQSLWPQYLANIISFFVIGFYWLSHHTIFGLIKKIDSIVVWMNIIFLVAISFLPFPVDLYGDYYNSSPVVAFYCASLAVAGFILLGIWIYVSRKTKLIDESVSSKKAMLYTLQFSVAPVVFAICIPLAFIYPAISQLAWIIIIIGFIFVRKSFKYN